MPCLIVLLALAVPRLVIAGLWLFANWFTGIFDSMLWPILGFIFLPATLLWYSAVQHWYGGEWGLWQVAGLVLTLLMDTSAARGGGRKS